MDPTSRPSMGDVNGDGQATIADALLLYRLVDGTISPAGLTCWDVDLDGLCTRADAITLYRWCLAQPDYDILPRP